MAYFSRDEAITRIPGNDITPFLDDDGDQIEDPGLYDTIVSVASNAADALVAAIYQTPFIVPPAKIKEASLIFFCEICYQRRNTPEEKNFFKPQADMWRQLLAQIGAGKQPLDANFRRAFTPGAAITNPTILSVDPITGDPLSLM